MLCTRVTTRGSAENEPSVSPATATLSPTTSCWSFRGIYLSARTRPFSCQMVFPLDSVSIKHSPPEMCITCTRTLPMIQNGCGIDAPVMRPPAMRMCVVLAIDRADIRSPKQVSGGICLQHHRHPRLANGARPIIEFRATRQARGEVATRDEHGVNRSIETNDAQRFIRFRLLLQRLL